MLGCKAVVAIVVTNIIAPVIKSVGVATDGALICCVVMQVLLEKPLRMRMLMNSKIRYNDNIKIDLGGNRL